MINTIGYRETERALQTGRVFTPKSALEIGLIDELVTTPDELMARAKERMNAWAKIPGTCNLIFKLCSRIIYICIIEIHLIKMLPEP